MIRSVRLTICSAVSLGALALTSLPAAAQDAAPPAAPQAAPAKEWGDFGIQTQWMDTSVKPGDDFNAFVNGKWIAAKQIPADRSRYGSFTELDDLSEQRVRGILDELAASNPAPGTPEARIAAAYKAFMDTGAIEAAGLAPAQPWLQRISDAKSPEDLVALFAAAGYASPLGTDVDADAKQSDRYALEVVQTGLGLPDRDYYLLDTPRYVEIRQKYVDYLTFLLTKAGHENPRAAAEGVLALETRMARSMWDRALRRDRDLTYNKLTLDEVRALPNGALLTKFVTDLGAKNVQEVIVAQMPPTKEELAAAKITPEMASKLGGGVPETLKLISDVPLATWQAWLTARFLSDNAAYLPREIDQAQFDFYGKLLNGQPEQRVRWKRGIDAVESQVGELLGQIYAQRYFPAANKAAMDDLVANLRKAMAVNLSGLKWMGTETRAQAEAKLDAFTPKIGGPAKYKTYEGLVISPTAPLANAIGGAKWALDDDVAKLGTPVDRSEWYMLPQTINAYYNPSFNEIVFPAAILQPPFFNLSADPAVNYGGIGAVIGHEMGHGFDDQGSKSDATGNLRNWWTPADQARFQELQDKLGAQYAAFCPFDEGKTCINPKLTMGENIGDLGGLSLAYRAYRLSLNGKEAPVIDGFTGDQRFFMGWAQVWRNKAREEAARQLLVVDPHSPPEYRINGIVRNFDEWYRAFNVQPGDKLYLPPEKRVRIW
jgi:putative endopeptidase